MCYLSGIFEATGDVGANLWPFSFGGDVTHSLSKVSCFLLKSFHFCRL